MRSSGSIFDPYVYRGKGSPGLPPMMTQDGLKTRWGIVRGHVKSGMCAGVIQARNESGTKTHFVHLNSDYRCRWVRAVHYQKGACGTVLRVTVYTTITFFRLIWTDAFDVDASKYECLKCYCKFQHPLRRYVQQFALFRSDLPFLEIVAVSSVQTSSGFPSATSSSFTENV